MIYDVELGYFKRGDDAGGFMWEVAQEAARASTPTGATPHEVQAQDVQRFFHNNPTAHAEALSRHAAMLEQSATSLRRLSSFAAEGLVKILEADVHHFTVECPEKVGDMLAAEQVLWPIQEDEESATDPGITT